MGNSGMDPKDASENCFVAGVLAPQIESLGDIVSLFLQTTRVVGTVDSDGFLTGNGLLHPDQGTLASTLVLTIRAQIDADLSGTLGGGVDVEVLLHRGMNGRERSLGHLVGGFGTGWQTFMLDVGVLDVRFPADPCPGQGPSESCGQDPVPRPNEISFVFTGNVEAFPVVFEVDWMTLEPKDQPGLAWRPVLLIHGLGVSSASWRPGTAWVDGLQARDVASYAVDLTEKGSIFNNGAELVPLVADLRRRFGVDRVHLLGHSKGGLDAREYVRLHDDVETVIMLASPNEGSFLADVFSAAAVTAAGGVGQIDVYVMGALEMDTPSMKTYNFFTGRNPKTTYVTAAGDNDSPSTSRWAALFGDNDSVVSVSSVECLPYAQAWTYLSSDFFSTHSGMRFNTRVVDDLFPAYIALLTPPAAAAAAARGRGLEAETAGGQTLTSGAGVVDGGVTAPYAAVVDPIAAAVFVMLGDQDALRFELVSPSGARIDAATPGVDPAVTATSFRDEGSLSYAGYHIEAPEAGNWTLEVTGTGAPSPDGGVHVVAVLAPLTPGTGVALEAAVEALHVAGATVTITASITEDDLAVTDATVEAVVAHPDGATTTQVALQLDGPAGAGAVSDGRYTGTFTATTQAGRYTAVVSAERTAPAFTREQPLRFTVSENSAAFSGSFSDHGVDTDGDGRFDQLLIDVGVQVDTATAYRVVGTLTDGAGTAIQQLRVEQQLEPGLQTVALAFDGAGLFALGHDGPYLLEDLVLEDVTTLTGLARSPTYTTAAYAHTDFQRPPLLLTGNTSDHGAHTVHMERLPYEELVVEVEVDTAVAADVEATANLHAEDGTFVTAGRTVSSLAPGLGLVAFHFPASQIFFGAGQTGPYTLQLLSIWGTAANDAAVSLQVPGIAAVTQPYRLEDFALSPRFTVGGTVTGLVGVGLELELVAEGPPGTPATTTLGRRVDGPFTFSFPTLVSGNPYQIRVKTQPSNPVQVCTVTNASGTIEDANVTNVEVHCG
jgi:pimeloyl-ACP methyl ester carboxylesterase